MMREKKEPAREAGLDFNKEVTNMIPDEIKEALYLGIETSEQVTPQTNPLTDDLRKSIVERWQSADGDFFELRSDGVYFVRASKGKNSSEQNAGIKICAPLRVICRTNTTDKEKFGKVLEWTDYNGNRRSMTVDYSKIQNNAADIRKDLANFGLGSMKLKSSRDYLQEYLAVVEPTKQIYLANRFGWHKNPKNGNHSFILSQRTVGDTDVAFDNRSDMRWVNTAGSLSEWKKQIAKPACASSRCVFAISVTFAAPLLDILDGYVGPRIFEFSGDSSTGKTFALLFAQSTMGYRDKLPNWRATATGLERMAFVHNDCTLFLDELGVADRVNDIPTSIYSLCSGSGRARSNTSLTLTPIDNWRLLGLATGELSLRQLALENHLNVKAGQEIRFVNIPADVHKGFGIFEKVPEGFKDLNDLSEEISTSFRCQYGIPFDKWIDRVVALRNADFNMMLKDELNKQINAFVEKAFDGEEYSAQALQVARTFGLVAVAGDLASGNLVSVLPDNLCENLTGWARNRPGKMGHAWWAALKCFRAWRNHFGKSKLSREDQNIIENAKSIFATQRSRFCAVSDTRVPPNHIGWTSELHSILLAGQPNESTEEFEYYVASQNYKESFCRGTSPKHVDKLLKEANLLTDVGRTIHPDSRGKKSTIVRVFRVP